MALPSTGVAHPIADQALAEALPKMLILRGIRGIFEGKSYPHGALDKDSAKAYALQQGYQPAVLDVAGEAYSGSPQVIAALKAIRKDSSISALYGFSGGGYNLRHIIAHLSENEKKRIKLLVVLGAPHNKPELYKGPWKLVYRLDPPSGHMAGPKALLAEQSPAGKA